MILILSFQTVHYKGFFITDKYEDNKIWFKALKFLHLYL